MVNGVSFKTTTEKISNKSWFYIPHCYFNILRVVQTLHSDSTTTARYFLCVHLKTIKRYYYCNIFLFLLFARNSNVCFLLQYILPKYNNIVEKICTR